MAEFVYGVAVNVLDKLSSISYNQICKVLGLEGDLERLEKTMANVKDVLLDAEDKQAHDKRITSWLTQLKDVFLDAEDVLDEFDCEEQRRRSVKKHGRTSRKIRRFFSRSNPLVFRLSVARAMEDIRERLDQIKADGRDFGLNVRPEEGRLSNESNEAQSYVDASEVIGRQSDRDRIISLLTEIASDDGNDKNHPKLPVISIRGLAGLGKSTLARLVFNDERMGRYFELKMWVYVSRDFDVQRLVRAILNSATGERSDSLTYDESQSRLRRILEGRRFLLVLDDVWNEDHHRWIQLKSFLTGGSKGSKIIVTTRSENVAKCMDAVSTHELKRLSEGHSLDLFLKCAFKEGREHDKQSQSLIEIARRIVVDKCNMIPLAVKALGSRLHANLDEQHWRHVLQSKMWEVVVEPRESDILAPLLVSYSALSSHLKRCFLYCSLFPKDRVICSLEVIQLWMAHGVLASKGNESRSLEDIGHQYFKELCSKSFFQNVKKQDWYYTFSMDDLIHDFAQFVAQSECWMVNSSDSGTCNKIRHLSINQLNKDEDPSCLDKLNSVPTKSVRTILFPFLLSEPLSNSFFTKYLRKFGYLRMLDLSFSSFKTLPSYIGRMKQLRNLNLSFNSKLTKLPDSISNLQSLQTLQLEGCSELERLPRNIGNLSSLMFLSITTMETCFPENGIECLTSLRTLIIVSCNNLRYLSDKMMRRLTALETFVISKCKNLALFEDQDEKVENLSLKKLVFIDLPEMDALPRWLQGCQDTLQYLHLASCPKLTALPFWIPKTTSIQQMEIKTCHKLCSLPEGMQCLAFLQEIRITMCPELRKFLESVNDENWSEKIRFVDNPEQQSQVRNEASTSGDLRENERFWAEEGDAKLIETLLELHNKGEFNVEDSFNEDCMEAIRKLLVAKLPGFEQTTEEIHSRMKTLQSNFRVVHDKLTGQNSSSFLCDSKKRNMTAEKEVWDALLQSRKEGMSSKNKTFLFYDKLCVIFGKDNATKKNSGIGGKENHMEGNDSSESTGNEENNIDLQAKISSSSFDNRLSMQKRETTSVGFGDHMGEAIKEAAHVIAEEIRDSNRLTRGIFQEINEKYTKLNGELLKISTLTVAERHKATRLISQNNATVHIFFSLPDEEKEEWVRGLLTGSI